MLRVVIFETKSKNSGAAARGPPVRRFSSFSFTFDDTLNKLLCELSRKFNALGRLVRKGTRS